MIPKQAIEKLKEWLLYKQGQVSTAKNKPATIGELMKIVEIIIEKHDS